MIDYILDIDRKLFIYLNNLGVDEWDFLWLFFSNKIVIFSFIIFVIFSHCYRLKIKECGVLILFFIICVSITDF